MMVEISCKKFETLSCNGLKTIHYIYIDLDLNTLYNQRIDIEMKKFNTKNYFYITMVAKNMKTETNV